MPRHVVHEALTDVAVAPCRSLRPPPASKQAKKCSRGKVNCGLLHDNMSLMWGEMKDAVDELQDEMNMKEIGAIIGVNESRVSQILSSTAKGLRQSLI